MNPKTVHIKRQSKLGLKLIKQKQKCIIERKRWFFEKGDIDKALAKLTKRKQMHR